MGEHFFKCETPLSEIEVYGAINIILCDQHTTQTITDVTLNFHGELLQLFYFLYKCIQWGFRNIICQLK